MSSSDVWVLGLHQGVGNFRGERGGEGGGGRERERKFLSLRCIPFSHLSFPFPPETPGTQAGVMGSCLWLSWCRSTNLLLLFLLLYCKTTRAHLFPLQCFTMNAKKTKQNKILARFSKLNWNCLYIFVYRWQWNKSIFLRLTSCICCHGALNIAGKVS